MNSKKKDIDSNEAFSEKKENHFNFNSANLLTEGLQLRKYYEDNQNLKDVAQKRRHNRLRLGWFFLVLGFFLLVIIGSSKLLIVKFWTDYVHWTVSEDIDEIKKELSLLFGKKEEVNALIDAYESLTERLGEIDFINNIDKISTISSSVDNLENQMNKLENNYKIFLKDIPIQYTIDVDYNNKKPGIFNDDPEFAEEIIKLENNISILRPFLNQLNLSTEKNITNADERGGSSSLVNLDKDQNEALNDINKSISTITNNLKIRESSNFSSKVKEIASVQKQIDDSINNAEKGIRKVQQDVLEKFKEVLSKKMESGLDNQTLFEKLKGQLEELKINANNTITLTNKTLDNMKKNISIFDSLTKPNQGTTENSKNEKTLTSSIKQVLEEINDGMKILTNSLGEGFETIYLGGLILSGLLLTFGVTSLWSASKQLDERKLDADAMMNTHIFVEYIKILHEKGISSDEVISTLARFLYKPSQKESSDAPSPPIAKIFQQLDGFRREVK